MIVIKNSPLHRVAKPSSTGRKAPSDASYIPFDSDDESDKKPPTQGSSTKQNSGALKNLPNSSVTNSSMTNPFDDDIDDREKEVSSSTSKFSFTYAQRNQ